MKTVFLAAFCRPELSTGIAQFVQAAKLNGAQTTVYQGLYDNTANGLEGQYIGGGD
jgi:hypothetical protein